MTKEDVKKCLREYAQYGCIQPSNHCREKMEERNINMDDIFNVLFWGEVETVDYNPDHDSWNCRVSGEDIDGEKLVFIAGIYGSCQTIRCITVF